MVFKLSLTFSDPSAGANAQRGFPSPGAGAQSTGEYTPPPARVPWVPERPTKGRPSTFMKRNAGKQRGFPSPLNRGEARPDGSMPNRPAQYGRNVEVYTPYYDRGAAAFVQNYGKVLYNPIGGGIPVTHRPQASYGPAADYVKGALWWVSQAVPTSVGLQGLTDPRTLGALLSRTTVQGVVRVSGAG